VGGTEVQLLLRELLLVDSAVHAKRVSDRVQEQHTHTHGHDIAHTHTALADW
jgi:hypothetical protein